MRHRPVRWFLAAVLIVALVGAGRAWTDLIVGALAVAGAAALALRASNRYH